MTDMTGGCLCGNLRYAADTEPIFSAVCHCKTRQKQTATAFRVVMAVPRPAVSLQGLQKTYTRMGESGQHVINRLLPRLRVDRRDRASSALQYYDGSGPCSSY